MINFKVFLRNDDNVDVRRFTADHSAVTNFIFMKEKIMTIFPVLRTTTFKITWKDSDDDEVTIVSDEDLITAFTEMEDSIKVLYATITDQQNSDIEADIPMGRVVCDGCDKPVVNFRYKCMQCPDYDLCAECEHKGLHSNHIMMRLCQQNMPRCVPKLMSMMSRSIRKDSHRASKHCFKAAKEASKASKCQRQPSFSSEKKSDCPLSGMVYDLAAPFVEALQSQATKQPPSTSGTYNDSYNYDLENVLRMVSSFFGPRATESAENANDNNGNPSNNGQTSQATPQPTATATNTAPAATATNAFPMPTGTVTNAFSIPTTVNTNPFPILNTATPINTSPIPTAPIIIPAPIQAEIPMVVDPPRQPSIYPTINESHRKEKPSEAGWTFVAPPTQLSLEETKIQEGLSHLAEMGFSSHLNLEELLRRFNGNVGHVVRHLFENNIQ